MTIKTIEMTDELKKFIEIVRQCMQDNIGNLSGKELLAMCAYNLGQILAFQDKNLPLDYYLTIIQLNIEKGNKDAVDEYNKRILN